MRMKCLNRYLLRVTAFDRNQQVSIHAIPRPDDPGFVAAHQAWLGKTLLPEGAASTIFMVAAELIVVHAAFLDEEPQN